MLAGVIDEMGIIEPNDLTARLFTSDSLMASGKVRLIIMSKIMCYAGRRLQS